MSAVRCVTCGAAMLRPMNLFGVRELIHPDTTCIPREPKAKRISHNWEARPCLGCGETFAQRKETKEPRKCCSEMCVAKVRRRNLLQFRNATSTYREKPRLGYLRKLYQTRETSFDRKIRERKERAAA